MYNEKEIIYIKALTPIHVGAGQGLNGVDMPIQREKHSNIPKIEGSSLKGSIKHWIYRKNKIDSAGDKVKKDFEEVLGPEDGNDFASRANFTDAKLLLFPIKSSEDVFKLVTCPYILKRWKEDFVLINNNENKELEWIDILNIEEGSYIEFKNIKENNVKDNKKKSVLLEEYVFERKNNKNTLEGLPLDKEQIDRVVIINDEEFIDLVTMYTEVITRNRIDIKTGATEKGGLFTEEYLPSESILYFLAFESDKYESREKEKDLTNTPLKFLKEMLGQVFQIGGDATIGKGLVKFIE